MVELHISVIHANTPEQIIMIESDRNLHSAMATQSNSQHVTVFAT